MIYESLYSDTDEQVLLNATIAGEKTVAYQSLYQQIEDSELINAAIAGEKLLLKNKRNLVQIGKLNRLDDFSFKLELSDMFWAIDLLAGVCRKNSIYE